MAILSTPELSAEIIESCRCGDREAFRALYEAYQDKVYSLALYFFRGDPSSASDITQQVFLKVMTNIGQFRGESSFATWLYRIESNLCLDAARRTTTQGKQAEPEVLLSLPEPASHEEEYARAQTALAVQAAVAELPPEFRLPVLLRYFEEMSYDEIAATLNCSMGTVASRLSRGHKLLAQKLADRRRR